MSGRQRYRIGYAVAVAAVALAAAACSAPGREQPSSQPAAGSTGSGTAARGAGPIKIAVVDAQSGALSDLGQFEWRGVSLAVSQANAAGGIDGRQIQLTLYDDQGDPTVGTELARKIASDGDVAMLGTAESAVTLAMAPILKSEQIPNITSGQSTMLIALHSPYLFLNGPTGLTYDTHARQVPGHHQGLQEDRDAHQQRLLRHGRAVRVQHRAQGARASPRSRRRWCRRTRRT